MEHEFTNACIVIAQYYAGFLDADRFVTLMQQLSFRVDDYNRAIFELEPFVSGVKETEKAKKCTKVETAIPKLHRYLKKLNNNEINEDSEVQGFQYKLDFTDLCHMPGNNHHLLTKSVDVIMNVVDFMSTSVNNLKAKASTQVTQAKTTTTIAGSSKPDNPPVIAKQQEKQKPAKSSFSDTVKSNKHKKPKEAKKTKKTPAPKSTIPAALRKVRLWIGVGDRDITEDLIRKWAKGWKVLNDDLTVTAITPKSFVCIFQSRLRTFPVPPGVKSGAFKREGPVVPYTDRLGALRLYVSDVPPSISEKDFKTQVGFCFTNLDMSNIQIRKLTSVNAPNSGRYCPTNRYYVRLLSLKHGTKPERVTRWSCPFNMSTWHSWKRPPPRYDLNETVSEPSIMESPRQQSRGSNGFAPERHSGGDRSGNRRR